jgi:hypothetical protein
MLRRGLFNEFICEDEDFLYHHTENDEFMYGKVDEFQVEALSIVQQGVMLLAILPRTYGGIKFNLMLFQHPLSLMPLCKLAFNCSRSFNGLSYLVKEICWTCKSKSVPSRCSGCFVAKYCSRECQVAHYPRHKKFCQMVKVSSPRIADSSENVEMKKM